MVSRTFRELIEQLDDAYAYASDVGQTRHVSIPALSDYVTADGRITEPPPSLNDLLGLFVVHELQGLNESDMAGVLDDAAAQLNAVSRRLRELIHDS